MEDIKNQNESLYTIINGKIYTANENNDFEESMILLNNKIVFIGSLEKSKQFIANNNIDVQKVKLIEIDSNQLIVPGFIDSHIHPMIGKVFEDTLTISECKSPQDIIDTIKDYMNSNKDKNFIVAAGYIDTMFTEEDPVHFKTIDKISKEIPILLTRNDGYAYLCNSPLLKLANITKDTPSPQGGWIQVNKEGELEGVCHDSAMALIHRVMPKFSIDAKHDILNSCLNHLMSIGITGFMDAAVKACNFEVYKHMYSDEEVSWKLPRCSLSILLKRSYIYTQIDDAEDEKAPDTVEFNLFQIDEFFKKNRIKDWWNNKLKVNTVKLFIDGVFESGTGSFRKCNCGMEDNEEDIPYTFNKEELQILIDYFYSNDIQIHSHSVGDLASKMMLDAIEESKKKFKDKENTERNYLAHLQLLPYEDIKRMADLKVHANMTPFWFKQDSFSESFHKFIGNHRLNEIYPIKTMIDMGVNIGFGSDWPVTTPVPLEGIEVAVTHRALGETSDKPIYNQNHIISLYDAVKAYTIGSAKILGLDHLVGTLEVGKLADLVILSKNIFDIPTWEIHRVKVLTTMIDGKITYIEH